MAWFMQPLDDRCSACLQEVALSSPHYIRPQWPEGCHADKPVFFKRIHRECEVRLEARREKSGIQPI